VNTVWAEEGRVVVLDIRKSRVLALVRRVETDQLIRLDRMTVAAVLRAAQITGS